MWILLQRVIKNGSTYEEIDLTLRVFTSECGVDIYNIALQNCCYVRDFFTLMVKEEVLQQISDQINIYAAQR